MKEDLGEKTEGTIYFIWEADHSPCKLIIIITCMIDYEMQDAGQLFLISTEY